MVHRYRALRTKLTRTEPEPRQHLEEFLFAFFAASLQIVDGRAAGSGNAAQ